MSDKSENLNALQHASSAYLRSAMHQPVQWNEWGEAVFALAQRENKPVLLDVGAVWCHWCHVMDRESYDDPEIAAIINQHYIAVKIDRDERPDVDSRYQAAVQAISGQGGWPLTAFLTSDGRPFFGGTYFPPEDSHGRAGFKRVLLTLAQAFHEKGGEIEESAQGVMAAISRGESFAGHTGPINPEMIDNLVRSAVKQFDPVHGGFGTQPKFPHPSALDLLIDSFARSRDQELKTVIETTLRKMAQGGVYDQLGGGFHRYSVDDKWIVPHFEKMSYDNSELLKNYVHAYRALGDGFYAGVANDIMRWMDSVLSDRESGGFYASQDADITLEDDGDYFTWTLEELRAALPDPLEAGLAAAYYDVEPVGEMHHNPLKNVLFVSSTIEQLATRFELDPQAVRQKLSIIKRKLLDTRARRPTPFIDKTIYASWNALCISAYLSAAGALGREDCQIFALRSLDRILRSGWSVADGLVHVIAYADGAVPLQPIAGVLDDYAFTANACLDAFEATAEAKYYEAALQIADAMIARFHDSTGQGFFDTGNSAVRQIGALTAQRKPLQDTPTPAGNPSAAIALSRLYSYGGDAKYRLIAEKCLEAFAGVVEHFGYFASTYGLALAHVLGEHTALLIIGGDQIAAEMLDVARGFWSTDSSLLHIKNVAQIQRLPLALRETIASLAGSPNTVALLCSGHSCRPPLYDPGELKLELANSLRAGRIQRV
ncbi:MAG: thioredoxin domain-containing protein [Acidobacteriaceae bacterium]